MFCTQCGANFEGSFCPACGQRAGQTTPTGSPMPAGAFPAAIPVDVGSRCGAYLIDVIPAVMVAFALGWIPILGAVLDGFVLLAYWLLRDINGASLGKLALGLKVVKKDGSESGTRERLLRNLTLCVGP